MNRAARREQLLDLLERRAWSVRSLESGEVVGGRADEDRVEPGRFEVRGDSKEVGRRARSLSGVAATG